MFELDYPAVREKTKTFIFSASYESLLGCLNPKDLHFTLTDAVFKQMDEYYTEQLLTQLANKDDEQVANKDDEQVDIIIAENEKKLEDEKNRVANEIHRIFKEQLIEALTNDFENDKHFLTQDKVSLLKAHLQIEEKAPALNRSEPAILQELALLKNELQLSKLQYALLETQRNLDKKKIDQENIASKEFLALLPIRLVLIVLIVLLIAAIPDILYPGSMAWVLVSLTLIAWVIGMAAFVSHAKLPSLKQQRIEVEKSIEALQKQEQRLKNDIETLQSDSKEKELSPPYQGSNAFFESSKAPTDKAPQNLSEDNNVAKP